MHWPAPSLRDRRWITVLGAVAAVAVVTIAVLARRGEDDTIIDHGPVDPPATERDPHIVASIQTGGPADAPPGAGLVFELQDDGSVFQGSEDRAGAAGVDHYRLSPRASSGRATCWPASTSARRTTASRASPTCPPRASTSTSTQPTTSPPT